MIKKILCIVVLATTTTNFAQKKLDFSVSNLPSSLLNNRNRVVINRDENHEILSQTIIKQNFSEINLIKNEDGLSELDRSIVYDKLSKIKNLEFKIYNSNGELVKTYKEKDFTDSSLADGFSILTDNRLKFLNFNYYTYPFFTKFDYETEEANTISLPSFSPLHSPEEKVLAASYQLIFPNGFIINKNESNLKEYNVLKNETSNSISYKVLNTEAPEYEDLNSDYVSFLPIVRFSNNTFALGNVKGVANNWNEFGIWYHENFLKGLNQLPEATVSKMKSLVKNAKSDFEKSKIIFDYVQNNTRYISIQIGIGGWKPFSASEVDRLGYGDCKALTNYTKSLLEAVDVNSYYTIIHANDKIVNIDEKNLSLQGNHVILTVPLTEGNVFLECTSQKIPFGYLGSFTDNRKALVIKPDGAYFVTTHSNNEDQNILEANIKVNLNNMEQVKTDVLFVNKGIFYNNIYSLNTKNKEEVSDYLKSVFSSLKNLNIADYKFEDDKENYVFKEVVQLNSGFIGSKMGNDFMVTINPFLNLERIPKKYKNRKTSFAISRGKTYKILTEFIIPEGYYISYKPEISNLNTKFGLHEITVHQEEKRIAITQNFVLKSGKYSKEDYEPYYQFIKAISLNNSSKFIISKAN